MLGRQGIRTITTAAVLCALLGACGEQEGSDAPSSSTTTPASSSSSSSGSGSSSSSTAGSTPTGQTSSPDRIEGPAEEQLTVAQAKKALPEVTSLPAGFKKRSSGTVDEDDVASGEDTSPKDCAALFLSGTDQTTFANDHRVAGANIRYSIPEGGQEVSGDVNVAISSYDEPFPLRFFDQAGQAVAGCADFRSGDSENTASAITAPALGDRTFAVRIGYPAIGQALDYLYVRSGHNVVRVLVRSNADEYDESLMEDLAKDTLDNLER